jgi:hypothetical protein
MDRRARDPLGTSPSFRMFVVTNPPRPLPPSNRVANWQLLSSSAGASREPITMGEHPWLEAAASASTEKARLSSFFKVWAVIHACQASAATLLTSPGLLGEAGEKRGEPRASPPR